MAKQSWSAIEGSGSAPYINGMLLPMGAHAENYKAPLPMFPYSVPNLIGIEAGGSLGLTANGTPAQEANGTPHHLVNQLEAAGVSWRAYVENIAPGQCPIQGQGPYTTWHVPFLYFDDVVGNPPASTATRCIAHVVPFGHLAQDLQTGSAPQYAFVVPNECNDMHQDCNTGDPVRQGDDWLAAHIPELLSSSAYARGSLVLIVWDFSPHGDVPIGLIALSAKAKPGYASTAPFTVGSTLRSLQEVFGVSPLLGGASSASDLSDLFTSFP
jgi:hypothetical protein